LQKLAGRALLQHVLDTAGQLQARSAVVVTGHGAADVEAALASGPGADAGFALKFVRQEPQLGPAMPCSRPCPRWRAMAWWWCCRAMCR
jgi:bifunctional UDP-N-acetylglucosamine pyrophosphorylase/glucosamine-1-phosphate N-acetyltransferase